MRIEYKKRFQKDFTRLSPRVKEQFYERLELFIKNKFDAQLSNHSVEKVFPSCRSINVTGDYRAIFSENTETITFVTINTHSELYK